jgi:hypothetical protein
MQFLAEFASINIRRESDVHLVVIVGFIPQYDLLIQVEMPSLPMIPSQDKIL